MIRPKLMLFLVIAFSAMVLTAGLSLRAQERAETKHAQAEILKGGPTVQDALLRPFNFPFTKPTSLGDVAKYLGRTLNAPVAIDRAALDRLGLKIDDPVQLELEGVRLKTGLKLLLDQLDMTFKVIPEDNLLVFTDSTGSTDPIDQLMTEIKSLHRDVHGTQDAIDEIRAALGLDVDAPKMHKPTIIEEMPADAGERDKEKDKKKEPPASVPSGRSRPGV